MRCEKCGSDLVSGAKFCDQCGKAAAEIDGDQPDQESNQTKRDELVGYIIFVVLALGGWWGWNSFTRGMDIEVYSCEIHRIEQCEWDNKIPTFAACDFTNIAKVPVKMSNIKTWSYSDKGVQLWNTLVHVGVVNPGRSVRINLNFDKETDHAYICSIDPESEMGRGVLKGRLIPVSIS